jgi:hypothetical protein
VISEKSRPSQREEYQWFKENRDTIIKDHYRENVLIHDKKVVGYYPNLDASADAADTMGFEPGTYTCQDCLPVDEDYVLFLPFGARPWEVE